ncbi:MAG: hypothetical protein K0R29_1639 [Pseudobdellovibrio sp.]|jgi:hypothetical protein|nr:hypothetical protein [Pseudobdellovibrio sp.]
MKSIIYAVLGVVFSTQLMAAEPTMIIVSILVPNYKSPMIQTGFHDSAFDYNEKNDLTPRNKSMCFTGPAADVCNQIRSFERSMNAGYRNGAHDNIRVYSCKMTTADTVETSYQLISDYGDDLRVERTIRPCLN